MIQHPIPSLLVVAAVLSGFTACQTTGSTNPQGLARFQKADTNKDGKLSRAECSDYFITNIFESRDKNHDHKLTWEEWKVDGVQGAKARFNARDKNKDGVISYEEALAYGRTRNDFEKAFKQADKNKDGFLSFAEVQAYYASKEGPPN